MKLSLVIAVLDSHEMVRRQLLHWRRMDLPEDVEIVLMDDGSSPPLSFPDCGVRNLTIHATNDFRPWTVALARNAGVKLSRAAYVLLTDIDHILLRDAIMEARAFTGDRMRFHREFGVLDADGIFTQDVPTLVSFGLPRERIRAKRLFAPFHGDSFVIRKELFWKAGGYREEDIIHYPPMGETHFKDDYRVLEYAGQATTAADGPMIYLVPNGYFCGEPDHNPFGLFHSLTRKTAGKELYTETLLKEARHG